MSNEKIAIGGVILLVIAVVASVTAVAINNIIDGNAYQIIVVSIGTAGISGLVGYLGGTLQEKIKHTKDIEIGHGKILDYNEQNESEGV